MDDSKAKVLVAALRDALVSLDMGSAAFVLVTVTASPEDDTAKLAIASTGSDKAVKAMLRLGLMAATGDPSLNAELLSSTEVELGSAKN